MKIKKYVGDTAHDAMLKLKMELGSEAVILNTKTIRQKGIFGFFKKPLVEITAAFEDKDILHLNSDKMYENQLNNINEELKELKKVIKEHSGDKSIKNDLPPILQNYYMRMVTNGIAPDIAFNLLSEIQNQIDFEKKDTKTIKKIVEFIISESLGNPQPITINGIQNKVFFVGPTGVGKTTTLAKIAANFVIEGKYNIGLITADTYRIGAVEQLKIYSEILQLPLKIAYNKDDMIKAFNYFRDKDLILIDTAGRSHKDSLQMSELNDILNSTPNKEIYLLINANIDYRGLESIIDKYNFLDDYKLIITKIDEAENYGNMLNIKYISNKELSYYTTGQNLPDDIQIIDVKNIVEKLINEENINDWSSRKIKKNYGIK